MGATMLVSLMAGLAGVLGGCCALFLTMSHDRLDQLIALGAGFVLGGALFTMLPEALAGSVNGPMYVAMGYLGLYMLHQWSTHADWVPAGPSVESMWAAIWGMVIHSSFDGAALGAVAHVDAHAGLVATLALFLHKLPEGFSLAALVLSATHSRRMALLATGLTGLATIMGAQATLIWSDFTSLSHRALMGLAAGSFLYVGTDMMPGVSGKKRTAWLMPIGVALVYLVTSLGGVKHSH